MTPIDFNNHLHRKYTLAFNEGKITKEKYDEFLEFYSFVIELYNYKMKRLNI